MPEKPRHFDVRASDDLNVADWVSDFRVMVRGFDGVFLAEAQREADRAGEGLRQQDPAAVAGATAAAILLAAAACEARLSEYVTEHASELGQPAVKALTDQPNALKQWRALLTHRQAKYRLDSSSPLACLFKLRNLVAHRQAEFLPPGAWPKKLKDCVAKQAIPVRKSKEIDWTSAVYEHRVAVWAFQTAADWLTTATSLGIRGIESVESGEIE